MIYEVIKIHHLWIGTIEKSVCFITKIKENLGYF